jgi:uncharacterized protein
VTIETEGRDPVTLTAGDTLVMLSGWIGTRHVHDTLRKIYVTVTDTPG